DVLFCCCFEPFSLLITDIFLGLTEKRELHVSLRRLDVGTHEFPNYLGRWHVFPLARLYEASSQLIFDANAKAGIFHRCARCVSTVYPECTNSLRAPGRSA